MFFFDFFYLELILNLNKRGAKRRRGQKWVNFLHKKIRIKKNVLTQNM